MARNVPISAASSSSIQPMKDLASPTTFGPEHGDREQHGGHGDEEQRYPVDADLPADAEVADPGVLADELEAGLVAG